MSASRLSGQNAAAYRFAVGVLRVALTKTCGAADFLWSGRLLANRVAHARRHRCDRTPVSGASSDVVWATEAAPAVSVEPEPGSAGCGDWRVNTDFGCMTCGQVRNDLRDRSAAIEAKYNA